MATAAQGSKQTKDAQKTLDPDWQRSRLVVSPDEAAEILGVSRATIYREMRARRLESATLGDTRSRRISVESLRRYVDQQFGAAKSGGR